MSMANLSGAVASGFGMVVAASPLLQIKRTLAKRRSDDVSLPFLLIMMFSTYLWSTYGLVTADWFILTPNAVAAVTMSANVIVVRRFRRCTFQPTGQSTLQEGVHPRSKTPGLD